MCPSQLSERNGSRWRSTTGPASTLSRARARMLTGRPRRSSQAAVTPRTSTAFQARSRLLCAPAYTAPEDPDLGWIGVVPGGHGGLQVPGLTVARSVACDPVERRLEKRQLVVEPSARMMADGGVAQPQARDQLVPAVPRPRTFYGDTSTVDTDPD